MFSDFSAKEKILAFTASLLVSNLLLSTEAKMHLNNGERICFFGDSITEEGMGPSGYVTLVRKKLAERFFNHNIDVIGAGISGDRIADLERRVDRDVLAVKPSVVVIYIGINDAWVDDPAQATLFNKFERSLENLIDKIQKSGARIVLCTPSVIGEKKVGLNPFDGDLDKISAIIHAAATKHKLELVDLRARFTSYLKAHNFANASEGILTVDGVHLNEKGNQIVENAIVDVFQ